jgi:hypothetical protein
MSSTIDAKNKTHPTKRTMPYGIPLGVCETQRNEMPPPVHRQVAAKAKSLERLQHNSDALHKLANLRRGTHAGIRISPMTKYSIQRVLERLMGASDKAITNEFLETLIAPIQGRSKNVR